MNYLNLYNFKSFFSLLIMTALFTACGTTEDVVDLKDTKTDEVEVVEQVVEENTPEEIITGEFRSTAGVQTKLSCYCSNGGTLTTAEGREVSVCFDGEKERVDNCELLTVKGSFVTEFLDSDGNNPCPSGSMTYFSVSMFKCK